MAKGETKADRMLATRLSYAAQDNPTMQYRRGGMPVSGPGVLGFGKVEKFVLFLRGLGPVKWVLRMQSDEEATKTKVYVDSDWAACQKTRRSTSGCLLFVGGHKLRTRSTTHPTMATSSGETQLSIMTTAGGLEGPRAEGDDKRARLFAAHGCGLWPSRLWPRGVWGR